MSFTSKQLLTVAADAIAGPRLTDAHIVRAISSTYYVIFHHFIDASANQFLGKSKSKLTRARDHYCRSVGHDLLAKRCKSAQNTKLAFPQSIVRYATTIYEMREKRCFADYDRNRFFHKADAAQCIVEVEERKKDFDKSARGDRVAFLIWANFDKRDRS